MKGGAKLQAKLAEIAKKSSATVEVGFPGGSYEDGTPIAAVAFWNEFGTATTPSRPFFRTMIANESPNWPKNIAALAKVTNYDGKKILAMMGDDIAGALKQSISGWTEPPNSKTTIARKGFNDPLVDSAKMKDSIKFEVKD